jgi:hypothetical protein
MLKETGRYNTENEHSDDSDGDVMEKKEGFVKGVLSWFKSGEEKKWDSDTDKGVNELLETYEPKYSGEDIDLEDNEEFVSILKEVHDVISDIPKNTTELSDNEKISLLRNVLIELDKVSDNPRAASKMLSGIEKNELKQIIDLVPDGIFDGVDEELLAKEFVRRGNVEQFDNWLDRAGIWTSHEQSQDLIREWLLYGYLKNKAENLASDNSEQKLAA